MSVFKEASFKRQRVRSKQHKNRESRESKGGEEGRERIPFCLSTKIVLIQYPCCMNFPYACIRSTISSHRAVRCSFFMVCLRGRPTFLLNQSAFHKAGMCNPERCACSFGQEVSTSQPKWVGKANHYLWYLPIGFRVSAFAWKKTTLWATEGIVAILHTYMKQWKCRFKSDAIIDWQFLK